MHNRSQAALEFLTTYAWAFLVILISISALYYFGVFDFSKFLPQSCLFPSQFECLDYSFTGNQIRFRLINNIGEQISVTRFNLTNDASTPLACTNPAVPFTWDNGLPMDFTFTNCQNGAFIKGERAEAKIRIQYYAINTPSQPRHNINGKITAVVT